MDQKWTEIVNELNKVYPLIDESKDYPNLDTALDDGIDKLLMESLGDDIVLNPLYVEDLLSDYINRISSCLVLREKANDIEERAISEALNHKIQAATLAATTAIDLKLDPIRAKMGQFATGIQQSPTSIEFTGNTDIWLGEKGVIEERKTLEKIQLDVLNTKVIKAGISGNGSNHIERFRFLKSLFDINIVEAYRRALVCSKALKAIYGLSLPVPKIRNVGYLNDLTLWGQQASNALDIEQDQRYYGEICFAISSLDENLKDYELLPSTKFVSQLNIGSIDFNLTSAHFEKSLMRNVLLRSAWLQIRAKDDLRVRVWPARVKIPESVLTDTLDTFPCIASSLFQDSPQNNSVIRGVHNINPIGAWSIVLPDRSITHEITKDEVKNIYLFLRVSYRRL